MANRDTHQEGLEAMPGMSTQALNQNARNAEEAEHKESFRQALKIYPNALFWSLMVSMCVVMEGYDTILLTNFYAYPQFAKKFGTFVASENSYQVPPAWQAGLSNSAGVGAFFGAIMNGFLVDRFGQKRVLIGALIALSMLLFIVFFAPNIQTLLTGEVLCGLPWGVFATTSPAYASEVLPLSLRVYMTSWTNMCFIIGQLIAAGVLAGLVNVPNEWSYRVPFALQWFWPAFLIPVLFFAPESPWHLVRKGRLEEAKASLQRLRRSSTASEIDIDSVLAQIIRTDKLERELLEVETSYWQCFQGVDLRRTEIACISFAGQVFAGLCFAYNSTYFFQQVGLTTDETYRLNIGGNGLAFFGTILSWILIIPRFGRRPIYLTGLFVMTVILFVIGILNVRTHDHAVGMTQATLTLVWTLVLQLSVGQLGWSLPAEVGSTRLRQKTIVLARNAYYIVYAVSSVLQQYFMNPTAWNLRGYTGFVWGSTAFLTFVWAFFRLPETKGKSYEELNLLFSQGISARRFNSYEVDAFVVEEGGVKDTVVHLEKVNA